MSAKKVAPKGGKKEEKKLVAVVMERKHGIWPLRHSHYHINVLELDASDDIERVIKAAKQGAKMSTEVAKVPLRFLAAEEVKIADKEFVKTRANEIRKILDI